MPGRATRRCKQPSLPPRGANGVDRHAEGTPHLGRSSRAAQHGADGARKTSLTIYSEHTKTAMTGESISLVSQTLGGLQRSGETTSVIDTINRRARFEKASFPVLILTVPNNPIRHSCTRSDYNCGATLIDAGMCVHVFSIEFACLRGRWSAPLCKISF
jgi:hypothetical protein